LILTPASARTAGRSNKPTGGSHVPQVVRCRLVVCLVSDARAHGAGSERRLPGPAEHDLADRYPTGLQPDRQPDHARQFRGLVQVLRPERHRRHDQRQRQSRRPGSGALRREGLTRQCLGRELAAIRDTNQFHGARYGLVLGAVDQSRPVGGLREHAHLAHDADAIALPDHIQVRRISHA